MISSTFLTLTSTVAQAPRCSLGAWKRAHCSMPSEHLLKEWIDEEWKGSGSMVLQWSGKCIFVFMNTSPLLIFLNDTGQLFKCEVTLSLAWLEIFQGKAFKKKKSWFICIIISTFHLLLDIFVPGLHDSLIIREKEKSDKMIKVRNCKRKL